MKAKKLLTRERVNEITGVFFLLVGLFTLVSLLFFHPSDHSFYTTYPNQDYRNITGITGVYLAHYLHLTFGLSSFSIAGLFLFWAGCFFLQKVPQKKWIEFVGIGISILAISSLFSLVAVESWKVKAGGVIGYFIAMSLEKYFGVMGGLIISFSFLALSLVLATDFLLYPIFERLVEWFQEKIQSVDDLIPQKKPTFAPKKMAQPKTSRQSLVQKLLSSKVKKFGFESHQESARSAKLRKIEETESSFKEALNSVIKIKKLNDPAPAKPAKTTVRSEPRIESKKIQTEEIPAQPHDISAFANDNANPAYILPSVDWLKKPTHAVAIEDDLQANSRILEETLRDFGVEVKVVEIEQGPVITRYEVLPAPGVKVTRIVSLSDDLALALKATSVRFITPIPGKSAIGIEIPNSATTMVYLRELLEDEEFKNGTAKLPLVLGKDTSGKAMVADLTEMPHLLIAGATGSGKTVCVNSIVMGLLYSKTPAQLRFVMVDPKMVEMAAYKGLPHMLTPVVTDVRKASVTLNWLVAEMERRYQLFAQCGTRNIQAFNTRKISPETQQENPEIPKSLPYIVLVIDELADLMVVAQDKVENAITRLAQLSRAVGIHLILATQRPSVDVITGVIKANFPARISFKVSSKVDSRTVLDINGADKLLGKGDMLFMKPGDPKPTRGQSTWVNDDEINQTVEFIKKQQAPQYLAEIEAAAEGKSSAGRQMEKDELYDEAVQVVLETRQASVSVLQRKLRLGYGRAARIIDMMEQEGIVGPFQGSKPREIYADRVQEVSETSSSDS